MRKAAELKRASFFIDVRALRRARVALGASSDAETVRISVERVAEIVASHDHDPPSSHDHDPGVPKPARS